MKYLLFLFGFFSFNVMALCSESPSLNDACRYPAGDSWCATKAEGKPYAYEDKCLSPADNTQKKFRPNDQAGEVLLGRCGGSNCSWSKHQKTKIITQSPKRLILEAAVLGGNSSHYDSYPSDYGKNVEIKWNEAPHRVVFICSLEYPSVDIDGETHYLDLYEGSFISNVMMPSVRMYFNYCHTYTGEPKKAIRQYGYHTRYHHKAGTGNTYSIINVIPSKYHGVWGDSAEQCVMSSERGTIRIDAKGIYAHEAGIHVERVKVDGLDLTVDGMEYWDDSLQWKGTETLSLRGNQLLHNGHSMVKCK